MASGAAVALLADWASRVRDRASPGRWWTPQTLPVAGIDPAYAQEAMFLLNAAGVDASTVDAWLLAVSIAQLCSDRLLRDLHTTEANLSFWQQQLSGGGSASHYAFMLLSRGPLTFAREVAAGWSHLVQLARRHGLISADGPPTEASASQSQQQQQPGATGTSTGPVVAGGSGSSSSVHTPLGGEGGSATDQMQQRVLVLRELRARLAAATAAVVEAAGSLKVEALGPLLGLVPGGAASGGSRVLNGQPRGGALGFAAGPAAAAAAAAGSASAKASSGGAQAAVEARVRGAVRRMCSALRQLTGQPEGPAAAAAADGSSPSPTTLQEDLRELLRLAALPPPAARALLLHRHVAEAVAAPAPASDALSTSTSTSATTASGGPAGSGGSDGGGGMARLVELSPGGGSAAAVLGAARRAAAMSGPLVALPAFAAMPSSFQRHWLRYGAVSLAAAYGGLFLVRHSRLAGSDDLENWIAAAATAVRTAITTHVAEPLAAVRDELFRTFRDTRPAIVTGREFALSRESLLRMLTQFAQDKGVQPDPSGEASSGPGGEPAAAVAGGGGLGDDAAVASGMAVLMHSYEEELKRPLKNLVAGDLARALLIQVQHVKVDGEAAMLRLDQILRANELSLSLMAALPALGACWAALVAAVRFAIPRAPDPKREAVPARLAMAALERALLQLQQQEQQQQQKQLQQQQQEAAGEADAEVVLEELRGQCVYRLYLVHAELVALYRRRDRTSRSSEWPLLSADLLALAAPWGPGVDGGGGSSSSSSSSRSSSTEQKLLVHGRMMRTYTVFQR